MLAFKKQTFITKIKIIRGKGVKMKKIIALLLVAVSILGSDISVYAANVNGKSPSVSSQESGKVKLRENIVDKPLSEFDNVVILDNSVESSNSVSLLSSVSATKKQTVSMYLRDAGKYAGKCTLTYKTEVLGGRPQFVYSTVTVGESWSSNVKYYVISLPSITFSGDEVTIRYTAQIGLIQDVITVVFHPN